MRTALLSPHATPRPPPPRLTTALASYDRRSPTRPLLYLGELMQADGISLHTARTFWPSGPVPKWFEALEASLLEEPAAPHRRVAGRWRVSAIRGTEEGEQPPPPSCATRLAPPRPDRRSSAVVLRPSLPRDAPPFPDQEAGYPSGEEPSIDDIESAGL